MAASGPCSSDGRSVRRSAAAAISKIPISRSVPATRNRPPPNFDVGDARLEQMARDAAPFVDDLVGRLTDDRYGELHRAAGMRTAAGPHARGVVRDIVDCRERHAEPFGDELRKARLVALPR
jgi:hypothetical protein